MDFMSFFKKSGEPQIFNAFPDGVILTDFNGRVLFANDVAKGFIPLHAGVFLHEVLGVNLDMLKDLINNPSQSVFKVTGDEGDCYVELNAAANDEAQKIIITARNVTQSHKFMKKMLVESESSKKVNRDKNAFIVKLSNELKAPLHSIDGFSKALIEGLGGELSEKQDKYLGIINKNSQDLLYLVDKVIEQARLEAGLYDWNYKHLDVINLLQTVVRPYKEVMEAKSIEFTVDMEGLSKRTCFTDESALKTILNSLLDLAIKSTYLGSINIKVEHPTLEYVIEQKIDCPEAANEKSFTQITVTDTGSGLTEAECNYIFDPYYQLETGNKKNIAKSISLAIDKALVKNMRGKIWCEGEAMQGSKFSFIIPNERLSV